MIKLISFLTLLTILLSFKINFDLIIKNGSNLTSIYQNDTIYKKNSFIYCFIALNVISPDVVAVVVWWWVFFADGTTVLG